MARILVVDDELEALGSIRRVLEDANHTVITAQHGQDALNLLREEDPELIILDVIMPDMSGIDVCKRIRANPFYSRIPILFLTAKSRPADIAQGLDAGGDDYVTKPFQVIELPARIRALLRRGYGGSARHDSETIAVGSLTVPHDQFVVYVSGHKHELTVIEHRLLYYLAMHARRPQSVEQLLEHVWEYPKGIGDPSLVYTHIKNLRRKLEPEPETPQYILNVRGRGYLINPSSSGE